MIKYLILSVLMLFSSSLLAGNEVTGERTQMRTEIPSVRWKALLTAMKHLQSREDYSPEQRKLENYEVWIEPAEKNLSVSFLAVPRLGDERTKGGNFSYARSTTYIVSSETFEILKVYGSR